jgi:hypothetical protein
VRRRVALLIEKWADVCKFPAELHGYVYRILLTLHGRQEDMVVRLAANSALRTGMDKIASCCSGKRQQQQGRAFHLHVAFVI